MYVLLSVGCNFHNPIVHKKVGKKAWTKFLCYFHVASCCWMSGEPERALDGQ